MAREKKEKLFEFRNLFVWDSWILPKGAVTRTCFPRERKAVSLLTNIPVAREASNGPILKIGFTLKRRDVLWQNPPTARMLT